MSTPPITRHPMTRPDAHHPMTTTHASLSPEEFAGLEEARL